MALAGPANQPPQISHDPVAAAVRGQPVTILAKVTDDAGAVKSVTLFYSPTQDAAPFRSVMTSSGAGIYYGTIPASMVTDADGISYYIEAADYVDATRETPWYAIRITDAKAPAPPVEPAQRPAQVQPAAPVPLVQPTAPASRPPEKDRSSLVGVGVIAGGAAAVLGGAFLLSQDDDGGGAGDGGTEPDASLAGTYDGNSTECFTPDGGSPSCETRAISIVIAEDGVVRSDDIYEGDAVQGTLSGNDFNLVAEVSGASTGEVVYSGSVVDDRIVGSIAGSAETPAGPGIYSGTFTAVRR
jgi:hypothetical protein